LAEILEVMLSLKRYKTELEPQKKKIRQEVADMSKFKE
jgi:hypothetical protein